MIYNCLDRSGAARTSCQATLAQAYQQKALLQDAMQAASGRLSQISSLMSQINATDDQKAVLEIQARIGAENAMLQHEMSQVAHAHGHGRQRGAHRPLARPGTSVRDADPDRQDLRLPALRLAMGTMLQDRLRADPAPLPR
jgi:hypothetical protein